MGNGSGLGKTISIDIETSGLTQDDIENAAAAAIANHGQATQIFMPLQSFFMMTGKHILSQPQYEGTEWQHMYKMTKREHAFAKLQVFLTKIGLQKHLQDDDERRADCYLAQKRLKRAKWARYQKKAV